MTRSGPVAFLAFALLVLPLGPASAQDEPAASGETAILTVVEGFHAALAARDSAAALGHLHREAMVYESGHAENLDEYRSGHLAADIEFGQAVSFQTVREMLVPTADLALYFREYTVKGNFRDRRIDGRGVETIVLERTSAGWKIRHIHWSSR